MTTKAYIDPQATDEAVLLLVRKLRRLFPEAHADLMKRLPLGARDALHFAEMRADTLRAYDQRDGITREYRDWQREIENQVAADCGDEDSANV